jgi:hypothetical protein
MANFFIAFGQHRDYTKIKFKSKLRSYSKALPNTGKYDITRTSVEEIINLLTVDLYSEKEKRELTNRIWLALSNPKNFDFIYKDYSISTIKNWGKKIKFEDPNFEPNPYLAEWTKKEDDILYFQWALTNILTYEGLMSYGDEAKKVYATIHNLKRLKQFRFPEPASTDYSDTYLHRINEVIQKKGFIILMFENNFDYIACKTSVKDELIKKFRKFYWAFAAP